MIFFFEREKEWGEPTVSKPVIRKESQKNGREKKMSGSRDLACTEISILSPFALGGGSFQQSWPSRPAGCGRHRLGRHLGLQTVCRKPS